MLISTCLGRFRSWDVVVLVLFTLVFTMYSYSYSLMIVLHFTTITNNSNTGADFDIESIQIVGTGAGAKIYFGDEFGPYVFWANPKGVVGGFIAAPRVQDKNWRSPDNHAVDARPNFVDETKFVTCTGCAFCADQASSGLSNGQITLTAADYDEADTQRCIWTIAASPGIKLKFQTFLSEGANDDGALTINECERRNCDVDTQGNGVRQLGLWTGVKTAAQLTEEFESTTRYMQLVWVTKSSWNTADRGFTATWTDETDDIARVRRSGGFEGMAKNKDESRVKIYICNV